MLSQTYVDSLLVLEKRVFDISNGAVDRRTVILLDKARFQKAYKDFDGAIATLNRIEPAAVSDSIKSKYYYELCLLYVLNNNTLAANGILDELKRFSIAGNSELLELLIYNDLHQWENCKRKLLKSAITRNKDTMQLSKLSITAKKKDADKAQLYSTILPGLGQVYAGKPGRGLTSFVLNGGTLAFAGISIYTGYYVTATNFGLLPWLKFYKGGIVYSERLCDAYNKQEAENLCEQYRKAIFDLLL